MATFKGEFGRVALQKCMGVIGYSFTLKNTDWFGKERVSVVLCDAYGQQPWYFRDLEIKAGQAMVFNRDTVGWDWAQGDFCGILDKNDAVRQRWELRLKVYAPGECPECHGTHKCRHCHGQGYPFDSKNFTVQPCPHCGGTGECQTCYVPQRQPGYAPPTGGAMPQPGQQGGFPGGNSAAQRQRAYADLTARIAELQAQVQQVEWDMRMMQLRGQDVTSASLYRTYINMRYNYNRQIIDLQHKLSNL